MAAEEKYSCDGLRGTKAGVQKSTSFDKARAADQRFDLSREIRWHETSAVAAQNANMLDTAVQGGHTTFLALKEEGCREGHYHGH